MDRPVLACLCQSLATGIAYISGFICGGDEILMHSINSFASCRSHVLHTVINCGNMHAGVASMFGEEGADSSYITA
jgi:hypothetical protein